MIITDHMSSEDLNASYCCPVAQWLEYGARVMGSIPGDCAYLDKMYSIISHFETPWKFCL